MDVIFYWSGCEAQKKIFEKNVISLAPVQSPIICDSIGDLAAILRRTLEGQAICVIVAGKKEEISELKSIKHLLRKQRLILILPDDSSESQEFGHTLFPRYMDSVKSDSDFATIAAVLAKMAKIDSPSFLNNQNPEMQFHLPSRREVS